MNDLILHDFELNPVASWSNPIPKDLVDYDLIESNKCVHLFDQNGYDLTPLEIEYSKWNTPNIKHPSLVMHRNEKHYSLQKPWFTQNEKFFGYVLNHSMLLERKSYSGDALQQLIDFSRKNPLIKKILSIKPKWGIDLSIDYVDPLDDNVFELLHFEYDSFDYSHIQNIKERIETTIKVTDLNFASQDLKDRKNEWYNLEFFEQSHYKCNYFSIPDERFKMVIWNESKI